MPDSAIIVWDNSVPGSRYVSYALIGDNGVVTKAPSILGSYRTHADAASDANGNVVVVYIQQESDPDTEYQRVLYQVLDTNGDSIVLETPLAGGVDLSARVHGEYGLRFVATFPPLVVVQEPVGGEMLPNTFTAIGSWLIAGISTFAVSIKLLLRKKKEN
jgi:hypothetical protein